MYHVLLATNQANVLDQLNAVTNWQDLHFRPPIIVSTAQEAIAVMESQRVDCVAYMLDKYNVQKLHRYLHSIRPSMPVFQIRRTLDEQQAIIRHARDVLDRLHADISDEVYDEDTIMGLLRDELSRDLLTGNIASESLLRGRLQLLRTDIAPDKPCVVYDFDMPQGEVYLSNQWHYGSERLENALRSNFFGRFYEDLYYGVAVLTPRHIRVVVCQSESGEGDTRDSLLSRADAHTNSAVEDIKRYLGLDLEMTGVQVLDILMALVAPEGQ